MGYRYNLNDREYGGSMSPRLNPEIVDRRLNAKLGRELPKPMVRETSTGSVSYGGQRQRRELIGLPGRLTRGED